MKPAHGKNVREAAAVAAVGMVGAAVEVVEAVATAAVAEAAAVAEEAVATAAAVGAAAVVAGATAVAAGVAVEAVAAAVDAATATKSDSCYSSFCNLTVPVRLLPVRFHRQIEHYNRQRSHFQPRHFPAGCTDPSDSHRS